VNSTRTFSQILFQKILVSAFWLAALLFLSLLQGCFHASRPCQNMTTSEDVSPNGQLKAVAFRRVCPEEHSITTHVSIIRANEKLTDGNGNVFGYDNEIAVRASWLSDTRLVIYTYADPAKGTRITQAGNVSVEYSKIVETFLVTPPLPAAESTGTPIITPAAGGSAQ
jgi:hypothetical protein